MFNPQVQPGELGLVENKRFELLTHGVQDQQVPNYAQFPSIWYPVKELTLRLCFVGAALNPSANRA